MNIFNDLLKHRIKYGNVIIPVIFDVDDNAWYGAKEVALALKYPNTKAAAQDAIRKNVFLKHRRAFYQFGFDNKDFHQRKLFIQEPGLYRLMLRSRKPEAIKFSTWIVEIVLPSIRKFGYYKLTEEHKRQYADIMQRINFLEEENRRLKRDNQKKATYPDGGLVYALDYSNKYENIFRIGQTTDMKVRTKIYDTHTLHNHSVAHLEETDDPRNLESCVLVLLHRYRYNDNNKKDFFECDLDTVKAAFKQCIVSFAIMEKQQTGGSSKSFLVNNLMNRTLQEQITIQNKLTRLDKKMIQLDKQIVSEQKRLKAQIEQKKMCTTNSGSKTAKRVTKK